MKLQISTIIDLPEETLIPEARYASAVQAVFDAITNYVTCKHLEDASEWLAKAKDKTTTEYRIFKHHKDLGEICSRLLWEYKEIT